MLALLLVMAAGSALAATGLGISEYEEQVSTYSINPDIPSYAEYCAQREVLQPEKEIILEAADAVRYEEEGGPDAPVLSESAEGRDGLSVLTGEEAVIRGRAGTLKSSGPFSWTAPCLTGSWRW